MNHNLIGTFALVSIVIVAAIVIVTVCARQAAAQQAEAMEKLARMDAALRRLSRPIPEGEPVRESTPPIVTIELVKNEPFWRSIDDLLGDMQPVSDDDGNPFEEFVNGLDWENE